MVAKISILRDQEKNLQSTLFLMREQDDQLLFKHQQLVEAMSKMRKDLQKIREERLKAEQLKKVEKADKEEKKE